MVHGFKVLMNFMFVRQWWDKKMLSLTDIRDYAAMCHALNDPMNLEVRMVTISEMIQHITDWTNKETWCYDLSSES